MWLLGEPGAARIDGGPALCYRGERSRLLRYARCSPVSRVHPFQSLIAAAFAPVGQGTGVRAPGSGSPRCASRRLRSRPYAVGGGGGGSFEQSPRRARRGRTVGHAPGSRSNAVDATSARSILHTRGLMLLAACKTLAKQASSIWSSYTVRRAGRALTELELTNNTSPDHQTQDSRRRLT